MFTMPFPKKIQNDAILAEALELIRDGGLEALSMRELAATLGVQASSLYRHFPNREAIEAALATKAATELETRMRNAAYSRTPADAFRCVAWEYLRFAREDPALFELLAGPYETGAAGKALRNLILEIIGAVTGNPDDTSAAVALWSFLHGFAILEGSGLFGASGPQEGYLAGIEALLRGFSSRLD